MAFAFENFALNDLVAKPEDAMRLASLAAGTGQRIPAYGGEYYRYWLGDAQVVVRTWNNYETGEMEIGGMDTHAASDAVWECEIADDLTPEYYDCLSRRLLVSGEQGGAAVVEVVNADVLPTFAVGTKVKLNMVGFPKWVQYYDNGEEYCAAQKNKDEILEEGDIYAYGYAVSHDSESGIQTDEENLVLLRGVVKDVKVGESYMGMEPMTTFIRTTVETVFGDVELCHIAEQVVEEQKEKVKVGATVSTLCFLSGDAAVGGLVGGVFFDEETDIILLKNFFENGGADRLRTAMHGECTYYSEVAKEPVQGLDNVIAILKDVEAALDADHCYFAYPARITEVEKVEGKAPCSYGVGKKCLLLAQGGPEQYVALVFVETDSFGRIRELRLSCDERYNFEKE